MALWGSKKEEILEALVEELRKEKEELKNQIKALQEALISVSAPTAYQDFRQMEEDEKRRKAMESDPEFKKQQKQARIVSAYLNAIESDDYFQSADDLISFFSRAVGPPRPEARNYKEES